MIVHELFLNGPVEPFYMGIHFRGTGIGPPVRDAARLQPLLEVAQEFRAVVGEHDPRGAWQHLAQGLQRAGRLAAGRGGRGHGDREARVGIEKGEQVAAEARLEPDDGITGEHLEGRGGVAAGFPRFARPHDGFRLAPRRQADGGVPHLVGRTGDQAPNGGDTGQGEAVGLTPRGQQDVEFGLPEVREGGAQTPDLLVQCGRAVGLAPSVGGTGAGGPGGGLTAGLGQRVFPARERPAADRIGILGRRRAMGGPERQNLESVVSFVGYHVPTIAQIGYSIEPPDPVAEMVDVHGDSSWVKECHMFLNLYRPPPSGFR